MRKISFLFAASFLSSLAFAQNGPNRAMISGDTIFVSSNYKVVLTDARRIATEPRLETPEIKAPDLTFDFILNPTVVANTIQIPKAERMDKRSAEIYKHNYIRAAYGNYNNALVDAWFAMPGKKGILTLDAHFMNTKPKPERLQNEFNSGIDGVRYFKKGNLFGGFRFISNNYRFYGYSTDSLGVGPANLKQNFQTFAGYAGWESRLKGRKKPYYRFSTNLYQTTQNTVGLYKPTELGLTIDGLYRMDLKKNSLTIDMSYDLQNYTSSVDTFTRHFVNIRPYYTLSSKDWSLDLGFNSSIIAEANRATRFKFFPKVTGVYTIQKDMLSLFGGIQGGVNKVSLRGLSEINPYIAPYQDLDISITQFQFDAGLKGKLGGNTAFNLRLIYRLQNDMPLFILDTLNYNWFINRRDDIKLIQFNAEIGHHFSEKFRAALSFNYYNYQANFYKEAYQLPNFDLKLNTTYNIGDKILLSADVFTVGRRFSYTAYTNETDAIKLKALVDASIGIDYRWKKQISAFIKLNNLANQKYQMWSQLPVNGITIMGGLAIGF